MDLDWVQSGALFWLLFGLGTGIVCGIGSACAGRSFFWGFFFGPFGIVAAAALAAGDRAADATASLAKQLHAGHAPGPQQGRHRTIAGLRQRQATCPACDGEFTLDQQALNTRRCPLCGVEFEV